jgi:hypothetical protein
MLCTFGSQPAAIKMEAFNRKFGGLKKGIAGQEMLQVMDRAIS